MIDSVLHPLEWVVAWLMVGFHQIFTAIGLPATSGFTWALSIVGLVVVIRIILIPLFVKQIHASRRMQLIQPEMQKIQKKYKGKTDPESRQAMTQETMGLYKRTGTNPFSSCLPILLQSPIFFALFRVLNSLTDIANGKKVPIGPLGKDLALQANTSTIFGGVSLASTFKHMLAVVNGVIDTVPSDTNTKIVCVVMIVLMSASTFTTQRQLMMKNMPASALDNPFAKQQKVLLYLMPLMFVFSGVTFPIGVLLYWLTTNLWSMGQQFYTIRRMPAPGSPAEKALEERRLKSGKEHKKFTIPGLTHDEPEAIQDSPIEDTRPKSGQRQQPKRKNRAKPTTQGDSSASAPPPASSNGSLKDAPATANGKAKGPKQPAPKNGNGKGVKAPSTSNGDGDAKVVKLPSTSNSDGDAKGVKPLEFSNGDGDAKVVKLPERDGNIKGVKPPVTEH
jgi:YidC/Oxa1 family membrane protein insertase